MKQFLLFLFLLLGSLVSGQDVTGIWRGSFHGKQSKLMEMLGEEDKYKFEVQINQNAKVFEGVTYSYKTTVFYGKATCRGTVNPKTKKVLLEELKLVELKMLQGNSACVMTCYLQYSKNDNEEFLEGTYTSFNNTDSTNCGGGTIFLRKVITSDFYKEPFLVEKEKKNKKVPPKTGTTAKVPSKPGTAATTAPGNKTSPAITKANSTKGTNAAPKAGGTKPAAPVNSARKPATSTTIPPANSTARSRSETAKKVPEKPDNKITLKPANSEVIGPDADKKPVKLPKVLSTRENELVKTILSPEGKISINIYDNGSVDNDTISVYLNKKLVLSKKRLTENAITLNFNLDDANDEQELIMVAENLGEIPPNTSLMVVTAGDKKYEVRITSTEQKNAVIIFKLQKDGTGN